MSAPTDIDPTFEDEVRAMLARHAGDVDPEALAPGLPEGVRIALVDERPGRRGPARWLTAAAVVVVLAVVGALVLRDDGRPTEEQATAPAPTTAPGRSDSTAVLPDLPAGIGVAHLLALWDPGADGADLDPMDVAGEYLADRIGAPAETIAMTVPPYDAELATVMWGEGEDWGAPLGTIHLEQRDGRWQVIAATAPETFDVAGARFADGRLQGTMANRGTQQWGVEIGPADRTASVQGLAGMVLGMPDDCSSPCEQDTGVYIAMPELVAGGGSAVPVELAPLGQPLAPVPHRLQAVTVRDDVGLTGGEDPQVTAPPALTFTEIVFDPTVPPVEAGGAPDGAGRPEHLASLPLGIDPTVGPVRTIEAWGATPEAAAEDLAVEVFGSADRVLGEPIAFPGADPDGLWAAGWASVVDLDPAAWPADRVGDVGGTVTVRRQDTGGWTAVAATSDALDLTAVRYSADDGGLRGTVRATVPAPLLVTVTTLAGEELASSALNTFSPDGQESSVLPLDDLLEVTDGQPLLLRVTAGDRPGQVGMDGVGAAAFASVVLPGWAEGGSDGGVPTTTAAEDEAGAAGAPTRESAGVLAGLMPMGVHPDSLAPLSFAGEPSDPDDPLRIAEAFLADRLPEPVGLSRWSVGPDLVAIDWWWPSDGEGPMPGEGSGTVVVRRDADGWQVVAAVSGAFDLSGVWVEDGWPTGEVRSTGTGEWWATVTTGAGYTAEQIGSIVAYVRSLGEEADTPPDTPPGTPPGTLPPPPSDRGSAPATLYVATGAPDEPGPFVELSPAG